MENNPSARIGRDNGAEMRSHSTSLPKPGSSAYGDLSQFPKHGVLPFRRTIRCHELRQIVPLAETTTYEMERRGEFPQRFNPTSRCVMWDLDEVDTWIEARKLASRSGVADASTGPDVRLRRSRPVRNASSR